MSHKDFKPKNLGFVFQRLTRRKNKPECNEGEVGNLCLVCFSDIIQVTIVFRKAITIAGITQFTSVMSRFLLKIKARDFYADILGFEVRSEVEMGGIYWMTLGEKRRLDGAEISLEPAGVQQFNQEYQATMFKKTIPQTAFKVDDIKAEYERLAKHGVEFKSNPVLQGEV